MKSPPELSDMACPREAPAEEGLSAGKTVFETAAFNHSATPPHGVWGLCP